MKTDLGGLKMLHDITGIEFAGAAFESKTSLQFFSQKTTERVSLIFGRNGSGKSTISRAVSKAVENDIIDDITSSRFVDSSNLSVTITKNEKNFIRVFNEDYTNTRIRLKEDGLSTIIMFGEAVDLAEKIEEAKTALDKATNDYSDQSKKLAPYNDIENILSPENHYEKIKNKLKGSLSWADRERLISGLKQNATVNDSVISDIMKTVPVRSCQDLSCTYDSEFAALQVAKMTGAAITTVVPSIGDYSSQLNEVMTLLAKKIEIPILSEREKKLLFLAQSGKQAMLNDIITEFSSKTNTCPFCLQSVSDEYKFELLRSIEKVLSKVAVEHSNGLERSKIKIPPVDLSIFEPIDKTIVANCRNALDSVNTEVSKCNSVIDKKIENLYTPISDFSFKILEAVDLLNKQLALLAEKKEEYNERIKHISNSQKILKDLNKELAYYEICSLYEDYTKQRKEKETEEGKLIDFASVQENANTILAKLNQQKENVKIAVDLINQGLQYVFFSSDKLKVNIQGNNYTLTSGNKPVKPKNISVGERNILALCYFFTELLSNVDEKEVHKSEYFIVLDDPVSSFDLENRVGIISYIKSQIFKILRGNQNSKVTMLSHDLMTIYDMEKALSEIKHQIKIKSDKAEIEMTYRVLELDKRRLSSLKLKERNEYSLILKTIYDYASNKSSDYELVIGNIIRRVLEAFGTFEFQKGIDAISCDSTIISYIPENLRDYFENLMYRLVLNGESHLLDRTKTITDYNFFSTISPDEKKRTAKDVLCLMFLLNGTHMRSQFIAMKDDISIDAIEDIKQWIEAIEAS